MTPTPSHSPIQSNSSSVIDQTPINDPLHQMQENSEEDQGSKKRKIVHLMTDQFLILIQCFQQQQQGIGSLLRHQTDSSASPHISVNTTHQTSTTKTSEYYNNAKYEDIICEPLKPAHDGSADNLIPFLNHLEICHQDEGWYPNTFITIDNSKLDVLHDFSKVDESTITAAAESQWSSPDIAKVKHTINHPTYTSRVLTQLLLASRISDLRHLKL
jgi:hypothetical protein